MVPRPAAPQRSLLPWKQACWECRCRCTTSEFVGGDGIVLKGVENTIRNVSKMAHDGMAETDREIIRLMIAPQEGVAGC